MEMLKSILRKIRREGLEVTIPFVIAYLALLVITAIFG